MTVRGTFPSGLSPLKMRPGYFERSKLGKSYEDGEMSSNVPTKGISFIARGAAHLRSPLTIDVNLLQKDRSQRHA